MPRKLFHITSLENLPAILTTGRLLCDRECRRLADRPRSIANERIKDFRSRRRVQRLDGILVAAGGVVADYVPFYFAFRSPMLYVNSKSPAGKRDGQRNIVYLVTDTQRATAGGSRWCFTDGHAVKGMSEYYDNLADLGNLDWDAIRQPYWTRTDEDKRKKQAEFLVYEQIGWERFLGIGVYDKGVQADVETMLLSAAHRPLVKVKREWYF